MKKTRIQNSELKLMEYLWEHGEMPAKELAALAAADIGWNKNTTYTLLGRLVEKGAVARRDPGFLCRALITRERAQSGETRELADRLFGGSVKTMFASFLEREKLSREELDELRALIDAHGREGGE